MTGGDLLSGYLAVLAEAGRAGGRDDGGAGGDGFGGDGFGDGGGATLVSGQFHDVVLRGAVAYRFPRDARSRRLLPGRVALLRVLGTRGLPAEVPAPLSDAALSEPLGRCHVALRRVPGEAAGPAQMAGAAELATAAGDLARLLSRLGELGRDAAVRAAVPHHDDRVWERFARDVAGVLFPLMSAAGRARARAELAGVQRADPAGDALVHGDLGSTNLLWRPGPRLAGVLDWDEAHLGSQADDLASIGASLGWPLAARIDALRHAGATPTLGDARAIAATFALQQALPAARSGDTASLDDGLSGYRDPPSVR